MKNFTYIISLSLLVLVSSCSISEDCFKGNGTPVTQTFPLENFTKIKVYDGVGLVIKEGPNYEVIIKTSDNILPNLEVKLEGDMLVVKDNSTCNITRDYGLTTVYVTSPNLNEIHSKTDQDIKSDGVLNFPNLKLVSLDLSDGAGTGDFYLILNNLNFFIESNNVSNFYISGESENTYIAFYWGNGIFHGENLKVGILNFFHRGSNDMIVYPIDKLEGTLYSTGNVVLKNKTNQSPNVMQLYTGKLIDDF